MSLWCPGQALARGYQAPWAFGCRTAFSGVMQLHSNPVEWARVASYIKKKSGILVHTHAPMAEHSLVASKRRKRRFFIALFEQQVTFYQHKSPVISCFAVSFPSVLLMFKELNICSDSADIASKQNITWTMWEQCRVPSSWVAGNWTCSVYCIIAFPLTSSWHSGSFPLLFCCLHWLCLLKPGRGLNRLKIASLYVVDCLPVPHSTVKALIVIDNGPSHCTVWAVRVSRD